MHQSGFLRRPLAIAASICAASLVPQAAALAVDAGQLTRQTQQQQEAAKKPAENALTLKPLQAAQSGSQVKFKATSFHLDGLPYDELRPLNALYAPLMGREVTLAEIEAVNAQAMAMLAQQGLLAFVFLPPQDVKDGIVKVRVLVAQSEGVELQGETRLSHERVMAYLKNLKPGQRVDTLQYQTLLQRLNEVPGVDVQGGFVPGQAVGSTKLQVQLQKAPLALADFSLDNQGNFSTGEQRFSAVLQLQGPLRLGDAWSATYSHTRGSDYLRTAASLPLGVQGLRVGVSASHMRYQLVAAELAILQAKGTSNTSGVDLVWPLLRRDDAQVTFQAQYEAKRFSNEANEAITTQYRAHAFQAGVQAQRMDGWLGGGVTSASVTLVRGLTDLDGSPNQEIDALTANTQGYFTLMRFALSRQQQLPRNWILNLQLSGQFANRNLDSSERFYVSGASAVRAYAGEGGGAEGQVYSAEVSRPLSETVRFGVFADAGRTRAYKDEKFWGAPALNTYWLKGQGVNLSWRPRQGVMVSATWSRRIGANPAAGPGGADSDGTVRKHRVWLQASVAL